MEAKSAPEREKAARKRRTNRGAPLAHPPRIETIVDIDDKACPCCKGQLHRIGEDASERLDIAPARFRVLVTPRPKYACPPARMWWRKLPRRRGELCGIFGDGVNQAADFFSDATSVPSRNVTPLTTFRTMRESG